MLHTRYHGREPALAAADGLRALAALDWTGAAGRPALVAYLPVARANPFQALLYGGLPAHNARAVPVFDVAGAGALAEAVRGDAELVVHVHWLNLVTAKASDEAGARAAGEAFLDRLRAARDAGARIAWTVHNILPHDSRFPEAEAALRAGVVDLAERVHVMAPGTRELVAPWFDLPEPKLLEVPHPSYDGVYPSFLGQAAARQELGVAAGVTAYAMVGALRPYKGLDELAAAHDRLSAREPGRHVLLVAGAPGPEPEVARFVAWAEAHPDVIGFFGKVPGEDMQVWLRAADLAVLPYRRSLNSGALALAETFGLPVVLSGSSGEAATVHPDYAQVYDPDDPDGLVEAMRTGSARLRTPAARAAARAAADAVAAPQVAATFAAAVRSWLDAPSDRRSRPAGAGASTGVAS